MKKEYFLLNPGITVADVALLCEQAIEQNIEQLSLPCILVKKAVGLLANTNIQVASVVGYPYGWPAVEAKLADTILSMVDGAAQIDLFINITALKNNDWQYLATELNTLNTVVRKQQCLLNIVIDPQWLTDQELQQCCDLYGIAGINSFTLFNEQGIAMDAQLALVRRHLADAIPLRAASNTDMTRSSHIASYAEIVK